MGSAGGRGGTAWLTEPLSYTQQVWFERVEREVISSLASVGVSALLLSYRAVCVVSAEAEQGKTAGAWMPRSFSILWPDLLIPVLCHLNQACFNLVEVRSEAGAGMYPPVLTASHMLRNRSWSHSTALVGDPCTLPLSGVVEPVCTEKCFASGRGNMGHASVRCCKVAKLPQQIEII